jgi:uncharacterized oxidoreductase
VELLSAGLAGGALIKDKPARTWIINSLFGILIDPMRLDADEAARAERIGSVTAFLRAARPQDPRDPVRAPGDKEREMRLARLRDGVPLDDETWRQIVEAAAGFGIDAEAE